MRKIEKRAVICMALAILLAAGMSVFLIRYFADGGKWASSAFNRHLYDSDGVLISGTVLDRDGDVLSSVENGHRTYYENETVRKATLHAVGDLYGKIGTGVLNAFADKLTGFDLVNGAFGAERGSNAVFVQNAFHELADSGFRVGAAITVHAVGTVDAKYDVGGPDRLDLHQVGSGDGHGHIKVVAAGMGDSLLNGDHAVLGRNERALLHDLAVSGGRGGISRDRKHARKHAAEQKNGSDALHGGNTFHMKYLRKEHDIALVIGVFKVGY